MAIQVEALGNGFVLIDNYKIINVLAVKAIEPQIDESEEGTFYPVYFCFEGQIKLQQHSYNIAYYCANEEDQNFLVQALWQILKKWSNAEPQFFERQDDEN